MKAQEAVCQLKRDAAQQVAGRRWLQKPRHPDLPRYQGRAATK